MKVTILGTGAYGLALASIAHKNKCTVTLWTPYKHEIENMIKTRENKLKLPGYIIPEDICITNNIKMSIDNSDLIIIATPTEAIKDIAKKLKPIIKSNQLICIASKGIEETTCKFAFDILEKALHTNNISIISGGAFAIDIIKEVPIGLSVAIKDYSNKEIIEKVLKNSFIKLRFNNDIIGTEICGAVKNIVAIAAGIIEGLNLPESSKAMFITEALNDIKNLISLLDGNKNTIMSFAGFGDILLSCTCRKSRNYSFGVMIGQKLDKKSINDYINSTTIEGLYTLKSIYKLLKNKNIKLPIIDLIYAIIYKNKSPEELLKFIIIKE